MKAFKRTLMYVVKVLHQQAAVSPADAAETRNCKLLQHQQLCDGDMMIFRLGKGPPSATNVVLVVVIRFSKIPQGFVNMQPIVHVIKLHVGIL